MAKKKYNPEAHERAHLQRQYAREQAIMKMYEDAMAEASRIVASAIVDPDKPFYFDDYPSIKKRIDELMSEVNKQLLNTIESGNQEEWDFSAIKNDAIIDSLATSTKIDKAFISEWKEPNLSALSAFQSRKIEGMNLSTRVWNLTKQFKEELELALDLGLGEGKSAADMSRDVRKYLRNPDKLFRRVRDKHGNLRLSKAAKAYHPGRGVYRSSYRNALRLTATENNMAYRTADYERRKKIPFIVGIEIKLSNNHTCKGVPGRFYDICDELKGVYPKDFKFVGWHPHCRCFAIDKISDDFEDYQSRLIAGEDVSNYKFKDEVTDLPKKFKDWYADNQDRIARAKSLPYFLRDNQKLIEKNIHKTITLENAQIHWDILNKDKFNNNIANKIDWETLHNDLTKTTSKHGIDLRAFDIELFHDKVKFNVSGRGFYLERTFEFLDNGLLDVHHNMFTLDEKYQGKGLSKDVFRALYKQYRNANVDQMTVFANIDVGGYTWARYGFYAENKFNALSAVKSEKAEKFIKQYYKNNSLKDNDPFPMRLIADMFGKDELLMSNWEGILNLRDAEARTVFEKYLGF